MKEKRKDKTPLQVRYDDVMGKKNELTATRRMIRESNMSMILLRLYQ